jgi:hypothetical protein
VDNIKQQIADVISSINGRSIVELSVSPESNYQSIKGRFKTEDGEEFAYELTEKDGEYSLSEQDD